MNFVGWGEYYDEIQTYRREKVGSLKFGDVNAIGIMMINIEVSYIICKC